MKYLSQKNQIRLCKYIAALLNSGIPLIKALEIAKAPKQIKERLINGETLSSSFAGHFSRPVVALLNIGEKTGRIGEMMLQCAEMMENEAKLKEKIFKEIFYPSIVFLMSICTIIFFICFALPQLNYVFKSMGIRLPQEMRALMLLSKNLPSISIASIFCAVIIFFSFKKNIFALHREYLRYHLPVISIIPRKLMTAKIMKSISIFLYSGFPINFAIGETALSTASILYSNALLRIKDKIVNGENFAKGVMDENIFDPLFPQMLSIAEESGCIDEILKDGAQILENEAGGMIKKLTQLVEPASTVLVGCVVGYIVFIMFLPMVSVLKGLE